MNKFTVEEFREIVKAIKYLGQELDRIPDERYLSDEVYEYASQLICAGNILKRKAKETI